MNMTLFGTTLDTAQIAGLVFLILALVLPLAALDRKSNYMAQFRQWGVDRKARRDAKLSPPDKTLSDKDKRGPWG